MNSTTPKNRSEQRDFFRISQDVIFDYQVIDSFTAEETEPQQAFTDDAPNSLLDELKQLDKNNTETLRLIGQQDQLIAEYLRNLNKKIDLIARQIMFQQETTNTKPKTRINLSEDGLAFIANRMLYKNSYIAVRLVFLPSFTPITAFAQIIRCEPKHEEQGAFHTAARFHGLSELNRKEIARQIMQSQRLNRRKATQKPPTPPIETPETKNKS